MARLRGPGLDCALAGGADPAGSAQLAARAAWLTSGKARAEIATGLERLLEAGTETRRWAVRPSPRRIEANSTELDELAGRLRGPEPLYARGIATLRQLVTDGTGPAYAGRGDDELARRLRVIQGQIGGLGR